MPNPTFDYMATDYPSQMGTEIGASTAGNWLNRLFNPGIAEDVQFAQNMYSQNRNLEWQEYMYNKYNSPEALVKQYEEAGLNPNMINSVNSSASATPASASGAPPLLSNGSDVLGNLMNLGEKIANPLNTIFNTIGQSIANKQARKMNPLLYEQVHETVNKIKAETDLTKGQLRKLDKMLPVLYEKAVADKDLVYQNIENLKKQIEVYDEQIKNLAEDTSLKQAQTGEVREEERLKREQRYKMEFERSFRELFGIDISQGNISMLVQAILKGHGSEIITALSDFVTSAVGAIPKGVENITKGFLDIPNNIGLNGYLNGSSFNPYWIGRRLGQKMRHRFGEISNSNVDFDLISDF